MKKLLSIFALALVTISAIAQDKASFHFGLKAAPSLAWLRTDTKGLEGNGSKLGFTYGLITEFNFADRYSFATGIDVAYRGGKLKNLITIKNGTGGDSTISTESNSTLQYIEIPITLKLKTNEIGYLTYYLQAGLAPGINIRSRQNNNISTQSVNNGTTTNYSSSEKDVDIKSDINTFNLSMVIGGGVEYTLSGSTVLLAGIQFNNGFLDVLDNKNAKANSNYLALTLGILF